MAMEEAEFSIGDAVWVPSSILKGFNIIGIIERVIQRDEQPEYDVRLGEGGSVIRVLEQYVTRRD